MLKGSVELGAPWAEAVSKLCIALSKLGLIQMLRAHVSSSKDRNFMKACVSSSNPNFTNLSCSMPYLA